MRDSKQMKHVKRVIRGSIKLPERNLLEMERKLGLPLLQSRKKTLVKRLVCIIGVLTAFCATSLITICRVCDHMRKDVELCSQSSFSPFIIVLCGLLSIGLMCIAIFCFRKYFRTKKIK